MRLTYRDAVPTDLNRLVELDAICFPPGVAYPRGLMRRLAFHPRSRTIVANADKILAFIVIRLSRDGVSEIATLDVDPSARRRGLGEKLMQDGEAWARAEGATLLALEVDQDNETALALYRKCGFEVAERYRDDDGKPRFVMTKLLSDAAV